MSADGAPDSTASWLALVVVTKVAVVPLGAARRAPGPVAVPAAAARDARSLTFQRGLEEVNAGSAATADGHDAALDDTMICAGASARRLRTLAMVKVSVDPVAMLA